MKPYQLLSLFFSLPFVIAAAFRYTDWMGWPTLVVCGVIWIGVCIQIGKLDVGETKQ